MSILEYFYENPLAQISGIVAMLVAVYGFFQKDDSKTVKLVMYAYIFWVIHFSIMELWAAVGGSAMVIIRLFLSLKYKKNKRIFLGIIAVTIVIGIVTFENNYSLLPIIGSCIAAYGYFFFERIRLRAFILVSSLFWFSFNIKVGSIGGMMNSIMVQTVLIITMYRMIHEEGKRVYIVDKVMDILHKPTPDFGRFITIHDVIKIRNLGIKNKLKHLRRKLKQKFQTKKRTKIHLF